MKNFATMCIALLMACAGFGLSSGVSFAADVRARPQSRPTMFRRIIFMQREGCATCMKLEQYSRGAIEANFKEQLNNKTLRFAEVNFDEPENRHFLQDYNLMYRSLVLVRYKDGKQVTYKNLEKIWQLVGSEKDFSDYVKTEVEAMLKEL